MAVSSMIEAIHSIFATPEYSARLPENVRNIFEVTTSNPTPYGIDSLTTSELNAVMDVLVDKISKQNIYGFEYAGLDATKYNKGYMAFGGIIEDDYVDIMDADDPADLPVASSYTTDSFDFSSYNPFVINYPSVSATYYMSKYYLQYHVTTTEDILKRAFISEGGAVDFVSRIRGVLPESAKLDKYLILKNMLALPEDGTTGIYAKNVGVSAAGDVFTAEESIIIVQTIRNYVAAMKYPTTEYNASGVTTTVKADDLVLFISEGIYNLLSSAQYNAYHRDLDFGCRVQLIDGFGENATTTGQFAALVDERGIKMYDWLRDRMDNIYNPVSTGYWNTYYKYGGLLGYGLHNNAVAFNLNNGSAS